MSDSNAIAPHSLYTGTGDQGSTGSGGRRVCKADQLPEALGDLDELNSWLGFLACDLPDHDASLLTGVQRRLMQLSSHLHGADIDADLPDWVPWIESEIDLLSMKLPKIAEFILPRGPIHIARAVCRRAERAVVRHLNAPGESLRESDSHCLVFLNRLSDLLFALARCHHQPDLFLKETGH